MFLGILTQRAHKEPFLLTALIRVLCSGAMEAHWRNTLSALSLICLLRTGLFLPWVAMATVAFITALDCSWCRRWAPAFLFLFFLTVNTVTLWPPWSLQRLGCALTPGTRIDLSFLGLPVSAVIPAGKVTKTGFGPESSWWREPV